MTKEEILKIIDQNRDVLTPENYLGILKNVDIFTEDEKKRIVEYLRVAKEMLRVNEDFMKKGLDELHQIKNQMIEQDKQVRREREHNQNSEDSSEADRMLGSL